MALLFIELVEPFAIAICRPRRTHRLLVSIDSLLSTLHPWDLHLILSNLCICHFIAAREASRKPVYIAVLSIANDVILRRGQTLTVPIWHTSLCSAYYFTVIPLSTCVICRPSL